MPFWVFIFLSTLAVLGALATVVQSNPVHCLLSLVVTLIVIGIMFLGLDAITVGFLQIIVYAGAIMVLFLFVIWLLNLNVERRAAPGHLGLKAFGMLFCAALTTEVFLVMWHAPSAASAKVTISAGFGSVNLLATTMFSQYLIAFEVTSVLLLAAVVGAVALARRLPTSEAGSSAGGDPPGAMAAQAAKGMDRTADNEVAQTEGAR